MQVYTVAKLGEKRSRTPEGYLYVKDVPVARTGTMVYSPIELHRAGYPNIKSNRSDGLVDVSRTADEVFRTETLESLLGKSFTNEHPATGVTPQNWRQITNGIVLNPRRGEAEGAEVTLADLLVYCDGQVGLIESGKDEVSCGYDCDYFQTDDGKVFQTKIIYNHLALVGSGRCGSVCAIGDSGEEIVKTLDKKTWIQGLKAKFASKDHAGAEKMIDEMPEEMMAEASDRKWTDEALEGKFGEIEKTANENHQKAMDCATDLHKKSMDSIEELKGMVSGKADKEKEADSAEAKEVAEAIKDELLEATEADLKSKDSALLSETFARTISLAEIIAPGVHLPTFDSKSTQVDTYKSICGLRRKALMFGNGDTKTNALIISANGGRDITNDAIGQLKCPKVRELFNATAEMKKIQNAKGQTATGDSAVVEAKKPKTITERNAERREFWKAQNKSDI